MNSIPKRNLDDPNTKGVNSIKFDLFDFSNPENPKRISLDMAYDPADPVMNMPPDGLKLTVTVGDNCSSSSLSLPLFVLHNAMTQLLQAHHNQKNAGLVGFDKKDIILPN